MVEVGVNVCKYASPVPWSVWALSLPTLYGNDIRYHVCVVDDHAAPQAQLARARTVTISL